MAKGNAKLTVPLDMLTIKKILTFTETTTVAAANVASINGGIGMPESKTHSPSLERRIMLNQDGIVGNDYKPQYIDRPDEDRWCPYCMTEGRRSNRYLYRCSNTECGRYW